MSAIDFEEIGHAGYGSKGDLDRWRYLRMAAGAPTTAMCHTAFLQAAYLNAEVPV
jgi:hypothetical protein